MRPDLTMTHRMIAVDVGAGFAVLGSLRKIVPGALAGLGLFFVAGAVSADEPVELSGDADPICHFMGSWSAVSSAGGASRDDLFGSTWSIPSTAFAGTDGTAVQGSDYTLTLRTDASCNTSHAISVFSARGGLSAVDDGSAPPSGFANRRPMIYSAYWSDGAGGAYGPASSQVRDFSPVGPNSTANASFYPSETWPAPGEREFELRLTLERPSVSQPMAAGSYRETVTITLLASP